MATGSQRAGLADLERRFGARVRTVQMTGNEEEDRRQMQRAAGGPIDVVLDLLPPAASPTWVRAAVLAVRPYGRAILMGGIRDDISLPYAWMMRYGIEVRGQWMYPRDAIQRMIKLVRSGQVSLGDVTEFPLEKVNEAVAHAAANSRALQDDGGQTLNPASLSTRCRGHSGPCPSPISSISKSVPPIR